MTLHQRRNLQNLIQLILEHDHNLPLITVIIHPKNPSHLVIATPSDLVNLTIQPPPHNLDVLKQAKTIAALIAKNLSSPI